MKRLRLIGRVLAAAIALASCTKSSRPMKASGGSAQTESATMTSGDSKSGIVFRTKDGKTISRDDLKHASGTVTWQISGEEGVPDEARRHHEAGRSAGSAGREDEALKLFEKSARLAPRWPYPAYDIAFTYLLKGDDRKALEWYRRTITLAPRGFFTAMTAAHYLGLEAAGEMPRGTYLAYLSLEWVESAQEKRQRLEALTKAVPGFAPAWKELALLLDDPAKQLAALETGLTRSPDPETRGFLLINKALVLARSDRQADATAILGELATQAGQPTDVQQIALFSLANITK